MLSKREKLFAAVSDLLGGRHHTAAVKSAVHRRRKPYFFELVTNTVNGNDRVCRFVVEQQPLNCYSRIIDVFLSLAAHFVAYFATITVYTVADAVDKAVCIAFYADRRQIFKIFGDVERFVVRSFAEVVRKVVARAERTVENIVSEVAVADKIDKSVQRSVAAADDESGAREKRVLS